MIAHPSRLPMALAPLIAEAKHRMRRRRSLAALVLAVAGVAVGLSFALRSPSGGTGLPRPLTASVRAGELKVLVPQGFSRAAIHDGIGRPPPVSGYVLADYSLPAATSGWIFPAESDPPANRVGLELNVWYGIGPAPSDQLHLPLSLRQPWSKQKLTDGTAGYRWGFLRFRKMDYEVMYWSGPDAPANDRTAILRALESIRPARLRR
jgi:hypothetical protein